jgi:glycerol-3-phosphate dehydrogenase
LTQEDIIASYVGVRPLVQDESGSEGKTSREHVILSDEQGFHFVAGGKYTTYRLMSEQIVDGVLKALPIEQRLGFKKCSTISPLNEFTSADQLHLAQAKAATVTERKLADRYGLEAFEILKKFDPAATYWQLEAYQAIYTTMCMNLTDFYTRRVPLILSRADHGLPFLDEVAAVFKKELILTTAEIEAQKKDLTNHINRELAWHYR